MAQSAALARTTLLDKPKPTVSSGTDGGFGISIRHSLREVETVWRSLTAERVESPGAPRLAENFFATFRKR